jgi:hypothetical protein
MKTAPFYMPIDPARDGEPCMILSCLATIDGRIWIGENARERAASGTRSLGTRWIEDVGPVTKKAWAAAERVVEERNRYTIYIPESK